MMLAAACSSSSSNCIQFFVRTISGKSLVLLANPNDTIGSIHGKILSATGIPLLKQRLIYDGKQLQWDYTLLQYNITNNSTLHLAYKAASIHSLDIVRALCEGRGLNRDESDLTWFVEIFPVYVTKRFSFALIYPDNMFVTSCVPEALVELYISPHKVLQFCKLLRKAVTQDDPLYIFCRNILIGMLNYLNNASIITVQDIFPFVDELATKLLQGLISSMESTGPSSTDVHDFKNSLQFMMNKIIDPMLFETVIPMQFYHNHPWYDHHQFGCLFPLYLNLLAKLQACLPRIGDNIKVIWKFKQDGAWDQYLPILKQLHCISQLYEGAEETFWTILGHNKVAFCYLIVRYAKRGDENYKWILNRKDITNSESRRHLIMMLLPEVTKDYENGHKMLIGRSDLLAESFESITTAKTDSLHDPISIEFTNEEATGPGVLREWFVLICQAIFNPQYALFLACPTDGRRLFPNPASKVNPGHLEYYRFAGRVIALALMHKMQVGIVFARTFCLQLAGIDVSWEDIKDDDPYLYNSCKQILEMDPCVVDQDVLGLTCTWEVDELGTKKVVELLPDGNEISVNSINRNQYIDLIIEHQFVASIVQQVSQFSQGFVDIVGNEENKNLFFKSLEHEGLDGMLHGSESEISVDDWKAHTQYRGYKETDRQVHWFWKIVGRMSVKQRKVLLFFWTSVKYLPVEGFCGLDSKLSIIKSDEKYERLPSSHTCFYQICFPSYPSKAIMQKRLDIITQEYVGCSFGTW